MDIGPTASMTGTCTYINFYFHVCFLFNKKFVRWVESKFNFVFVVYHRYPLWSCHRWHIWLEKNGSYQHGDYWTGSVQLACWTGINGCHNKNHRINKTNVLHFLIDCRLCYQFNEALFQRTYWRTYYQVDQRCSSTIR